MNTNYTVTKKDEQIDSIIDIPCSKCKRKTKHTILSDITLNGTFEDIDWYEDYQIIQCRGCETISFRKTHQNSENIDPINGYETFEDIYPNPEQGRTLISDYNILPSKLYKIYSETISSLNLNLRILTGIGIRAIVETICKDKNASGSKLYDKINDLVTQGVLTQDGANILHKLFILSSQYN